MILQLLVKYVYYSFPIVTNKNSLFHFDVRAFVITRMLKVANNISFIVNCRHFIFYFTFRGYIYVNMHLIVVLFSYKYPFTKSHNCIFVSFKRIKRGREQTK